MRVVTMSFGKFGEEETTNIYPAGVRNFGKATLTKIEQYARSIGESIIHQSSQYVTITGTHIFDNI